MGRKSTEKLRKSKQEKIDAWMLELLPKMQAYSPQKITMDQLAALIGKRKSTIYEYFSSKEEVILYAAQLRIKQLSHYRELIDWEAADVRSVYTMLMELICKGRWHFSTRQRKMYHLTKHSIWYEQTRR